MCQHFVRSGVRIFFRLYSTSSQQFAVPYERNGEKNLYRSRISINTKNEDVVNLDAVYLGSSRGTLFVIHGAPGSHKDFKYVTPILQERDIRVVAVNFPGLGYSSYDERLSNDNDEREQFLRKILEGLNIRDRIVIAGHSRGSVDAIRLAAKLQDNVLGLVPINFVGLRPHRGIRPFGAVKAGAFLWSFPSIRFFLSPLYYQFYNRVLNFRVTGEVAGLCMTIMRNIDFEGQNQFVNQLSRSNLKIFAPFSGKDVLSEVEISREVTDRFENNKELTCSNADNEDELIETAVGELKSGRKHLSVNFEDDGHYLQKHRAKFLSYAIDALFPPSHS